MSGSHSDNLVSFIVYKHSGDLIDTEETIDLLSALGEVAKTEKLDVDTQHSMKLPPAVVASYKMYDPKRDVPLVCMDLSSFVPFLTCLSSFVEIASTR